MSDFDLNLVTASISPSIQDVRELHALSPPSAARYALVLFISLQCESIKNNCNLTLVILISTIIAKAVHNHVWQLTLVENKHYSTVSGLIGLVIIISRMLY